PVPLDLGISKFDLLWSVRERPGSAGIHGILEYSADLYDEATVAGLVRRLERVLRAVVADPDRRISGVDLLQDDERQRVLVEWNDTARQLPRTPWPVLFEARTARRPDAIAVRHDGDGIGYAELNARANRLARWLLAHGAGPETVIGLALPRSAELVAAVLAVVKTGAAYLSIDPDLPAARARFMCADAAPLYVLTTGTSGERIPQEVPCHRLDDPAVRAEVERHSAVDLTDAERSSPLDASHPAYLVYTSGSTGTPKGVQVTHQGLAGLAVAHQEALGLDADARVLQFASLNFDASACELVMTLLAGATLVVPRPDQIIGDGVVALIDRERVSHAMLPPAFIATLDPATVPTLRALITGGEACPPDVAARWSRGRRMLNAYGPTESTVCATLSAPLSGEIAAPIGRPIANTRVYVLGPGLRPVPAGVVGQLYLAGAGLA
ncbi:AMP-binding protein, partial [Streptomyces coffeae]